MIHFRHPTFVGKDMVEGLRRVCMHCCGPCRVPFTLLVPSVHHPCAHTKGTCLINLLAWRWERGRLAWRLARARRARTFVAEFLMHENGAQGECYAAAVCAHFPGTAQSGQEVSILCVQQLHSFQTLIVRFAQLLSILQSTSFGTYRSTPHLSERPITSQSCT